MHDLPTEWSALAALVFLLGLKHGFDADHLAAIDGLTRHNTRHGRGFARSCGVTVADLLRLDTDKGAWLAYRVVEAGRAAAELLPDIAAQAQRAVEEADVVLFVVDAAVGD